MIKRPTRTALIERRKELGLSQRNMAEAIGIHRSHYCKIEKGFRTTNVENAWQILKLLKADGKLELFISEEKKICNQK